MASTRAERDRRMRAAGGAAALLLLAAGTTDAARGEAPDAAAGDPGFLTGLFAPSRNNLLGDVWGLRPFAGNLGVSFGMTEQSEDLGNLTGGIHRGFDYDGLLVVSLGIDTAKAFGWPGGTFNVSAEQIHGRSVSADNLDDLQTVSGIEAERSTRLWEIWFQQQFAGGKMDIKVGQQSLDQEFISSSYSGLYLNTMAGWPLLPSYDMYAGGPAYPLSSLGVRVRLLPSSAVTILAGVFDDNPPGGPFNNDDQVRGAEQSGTEFNLGTGALSIVEVQYAINQPATGDMVASGGGSAPAGLPGTYRFGAWYDSGAFPDQRFDEEGLSLASPAGNAAGVLFASGAGSGAARNHRGNYSLYAIMDQMVWRPGPSDPRSLGVFLRMMGAPGDRNLISFSASGGINLKAPFESRPGDTAGIGFGVGQVSRAAAALDAETPGTPVRTVETFVELTYQAQVANWWTVQPDVQFVMHPGGGLADPTDPGHEIGDELVVGARTAITF